jgi:hypothetical protein
LAIVQIRALQCMILSRRRIDEIASACFEGERVTPR